MVTSMTPGSRPTSKHTLILFDPLSPIIPQLSDVGCLDVGNRQRHADVLLAPRADQFSNCPVIPMHPSRKHHHPPPSLKRRLYPPNHFLHWLAQHSRTLEPGIGS